MTNYETIATEWTDPELGRLVIRSNVRARSIIMRTRPDGIYITIPPHTQKKELMDTLDKFRMKLIASREKVAPPTRYDLNFKIHTNLLHLNLELGNQERFLAQSDMIHPLDSDLQPNENAKIDNIPLCALMDEPRTWFRSGRNVIICPPHTDFTDPTLQEWLRKAIKEMVRRQAKAYLPVRLRQLAQTYNFNYEKVQINSSQTRWGSCSTRRSINLSLYLMTVPPHLIDYVLLHELCHTLEMNHGPRFWELLDSVTKGKAHSMRNELRTYKTSF